MAENETLPQLTTVSTIESGDLLYLVRSSTMDRAISGANLILQFGLPSQTGNSGKFLTTNGTVASWGNTGVFSTLTVGGGSQFTRMTVGAVSLSGGAATVADASVTNGSLVLLNRRVDSGTIGCSYSISVNGGVGFSIQAKDSTGSNESGDASQLSYLLIET